MRRILLPSFIVLVASVSCFAQLGDILRSAKTQCNHPTLTSPALAMARSLPG